MLENVKIYIPIISLKQKSYLTKISCKIPILLIYCFLPKNTAFGKKEGLLGKMVFSFAFHLISKKIRCVKLMDIQSPSGCDYPTKIKSRSYAR